MENWKITAATIYCDAVGCEVTLMVYKDWSVKCTGYEKYGKLGQKSRQSKKPLNCEVLECPQVKRYKEKLSGEENTKLNTSPIKG